MNPVVLYCKSYSGDLHRVEILLNSIGKHNKDNIPFFISCPKESANLFYRMIRDANINGVTLIADEEILGGTNLNQSWKNQQIVKSRFWTVGECENYVCLDSDSYFIKDFYKSDFLHHDSVPYTVMHEQKDLFSWTVGNTQKLGFDPKKSFHESRQPIMDLFDRKGRLYDFGPVPVIWSSKVWQTLEEEYIKPNELTFEGLIGTVASEFTWYGEWLLVRRPIELWPIEPVFKVFHYLQQYHDFKNQGYTLDNWAQNYLGVVMQSSSGLPLTY